MTSPEDPCDDLGHPVPVARPAGLEVTRVRGAKNPNLAAIPVWRDPWMVVGSATFTGDLAARPDLIVLPDEPYQFSAGDGPEMFPGQRVSLVEGRSLTWYGPSLVTAPLS
jgi:hypothetical protein